MTNESVNLNNQEMILTFLQFKIFHLLDSNLKEDVFNMVIVSMGLQEEQNGQTAICK